MQGVFFRETFRKEAENFGVTGWVRNRSDGTVEAFVQGTEKQLEAILAVAHKGSPTSRVDKVEVSNGEVDSTLTDFRRTETV